MSLAVFLSLPALAAESARPLSPLAQRLAERIRLGGPALESALHPHVLKLRATPRDATLSTTIRARIAAQMRAQATTSETPPIRFAEPPTFDSIPLPLSTIVPDSLSAGMASFAVGDLNHDGLADVASVTSSDSTLVVRVNLGGGMYAPGVRYPLAQGAYKLALADFDGDGDLDVAIANQNPAVISGTYSVLKNSGSGSLGPRTDRALTRSPVDVSAVDIGQEGRFDLVFALAYSSSADIVRSRSDGGFEPAYNFATDPLEPHYQSALSVGDLDGDGNPDLALVWRNGDCNGSGACATLSICFGRVDGTFEPRADYQGYDANSSASSPGLIPALTFQDVDGDHAADLVVRPLAYEGAPPTTGPGAALVRSFGVRGFEAPFVRSSSTTAWDLLAGHFRPGHLDDLAYSNDDSVFTIRSLGNGTCDAEQYLTRGRLRAVVDLNGDGFGDVVVSRNDTTEIRISNGSGGFAPAQWHIGGGFLAIADFTGDHRKDLATMLPSGDVQVLEGDGLGGFATPHNFGPALFGSQTSGQTPVQAVDLDGDGRADLATVLGGFSPSSNDSLVVNWNVGGAFSPPSFFDFGPDRENEYADHTWPMDLKSGDFNGDGRPDLAVIKGAGQLGIVGYISMIPNLGHGAFGSPSPLLVAGEDPYNAVVADFDGDGRQDIAVAAASTDYTGYFYVFRGLPNGILESAATPYSREGYAVRHWAFSVAAGDFNGDGRPDVAVGCGVPSYQGAAILVVPNTTEGFGVTPVLVSVVNSSALPGQVSLLWDLAGSQPSAIVIQRRSVSSDWSLLADASPDGSGHVQFDDRAVEAGARYGYRLELTCSGSVTTLGETWVDVPSALAFALEGAQPNPSRGVLSIAFTLANSTRATVDVLDVSGRRVRTHTLDAPTPGRQRVSLANEGPLSPGLYFVRLTQEHRSALTRVAVVR